MLFNKLPAWFITFVFFSVVIPASSSHQCQDGMYKHDGRHCCLCGAGLYLVEHCSTNLTHSECMPCESGTYRSEPNAETSCEPCRSCEQEDASLQVAEPCTSARNRKCQCKKDHYCIPHGTEVCRLCHPCNKCDAEGIKVPCTGNSNTVCKDKVEGGNQGGVIAGVIVFIIVLVTVCIGVFLWKRKHGGTPVPGSNGNGNDVESQGLQGVDMQPHLPAVVEVIGWKVMRDLAMHSGIRDTVISNCQLNHPHDVQEQTLELLKVWVESEGSGASNKLLDMLRSTGKRDKYEKVHKILYLS